MSLPPPPNAPPPPIPDAQPTMGPTGTRIWRTVFGLALGPLILCLPISGLTAAFKPIVYAAVAAVSVVGVLWAFKVVSALTLLNVFTAGVVIIGLVAGSGIDGSNSFGYLLAGFAGLICLGIWLSFVLKGRSERRPRWWLNPNWWLVPILAVAAFALTSTVHDTRFENSRTELTAYAEQQLAIPLKGDGTGRCDHYNPPAEIGSYRVTYSCVSEHNGRFGLSVSVHFDDSSEFELDYGDDTLTGQRVWQKYGTHS